MSEDSDWWDKALTYVGEKGATPASLAELLEQQMLLQAIGGERGELRIPFAAAKLIVAALKRTPQSRTDSRITWREHKTYDLLIEKAKRHRDELVKKGSKRTDAELEAAEWLQEELPMLSVDKIRRDLQRRDHGTPYRR